jgi:hypothetical protein
MSDEIVMRAESLLEARLRDRECHLRWGRELVARRDRAAQITTYDPTVRQALDSIMEALASHARELVDIDANIVAHRERLARAKAGLREREAVRRAAMIEGARRDAAQMDRANARPVEGMLHQRRASMGPPGSEGFEIRPGVRSR